MIWLINNEITAIVPQYTDVGDITRVYMAKVKDPVDVELSIRTFVDRMLKLYAIDKKAMHKIFRGLGIQKNAPIVLYDKVFAKIKTRKPRAKGDSAYSYIDPSHIEYASQTSDGIEVKLKTEEKILCISSYATFAKSIMQAQTIRDRKIIKIISPYDFKD